LRRTSIGLEDEQFTRLEVIARIDGRSLSDVIREAVDLLVDTRLEDKSFITKAEQVAAEIQDFVHTSKGSGKSQGTNAA